jgi:hypothetical protein
MSEEIITEKEDIHNGIDFLKPDKKLKPISKRFASEFKTFDTIKENTKKSYKSSVRCMHYYYTGIKLTDEDDIIKIIYGLPYKKANITKMFKYLKDDRYVYDMVVKFTNRLSIIYGLFSHIRGFTPFIKKIYPYIEQYAIQYKDSRFDYKIDEKLIELLSFNKQDILDRLENYKKNFDRLVRYSKPITNNEILIYLLLTLMPTRRAYDFERTKIIDKVPDKDIDRSFNYYYDKHIYIYDTKNKRDYIMLLPDEIISYIDITKPFLFGNNIKQLSIIIPKVFNKLYGHPYTAREIRKLYATYSNNTQFSMRERFANAAAMGHSMEENLRYSYK